MAETNIEKIVYNQDFDSKLFKEYSQKFIDADKQILSCGPSELGIVLIDYSLAGYKEFNDETFLNTGSFLGESINAIWKSKWYFSKAQNIWVIKLQEKDVEINVFKKNKRKIKR